jgi:hypothetical protein
MTTVMIKQSNGILNPSFCDCPTGIQQFMHTGSGLIWSCLLVQVQVKLLINTITIQSSPWSTISLVFEYWKSFFTDAIIWSNSQLLLLWTGSCCGLGFLISGVQCANLYDYRLVLTTTTHLGICKNVSTFVFDRVCISLDCELHGHKISEGSR